MDVLVTERINSSITETLKMRPSSVETNIATNVPAFLSKLWKMVNDPGTDHLISWSPGGHSFVIQNEAQFWYNLLPIYYKHNNMSSFIRQLNMYDFHKISSENGLESDNEIKFFHPCFQKDQPNLMKLIKRKIANSRTSTATSEENKVTGIDHITKVLVDVKHLRGRQECVDNQLIAMKQENTALWRELALLRQKHLKQQQIVNKLIHFLATIVQPPKGGLGGLGVKRRFPLMINDGSRYSKVPKTLETDGPVIHELDPDSLFLNDVSSEEQEQEVDEDPDLDLALEPFEPAASQIQSIVESPTSSANTLIDAASPGCLELDDALSNEAISTTICNDGLLDDDDDFSLAITDEAQTQKTPLTDYVIPLTNTTTVQEEDEEQGQTQKLDETHENINLPAKQIFLNPNMSDTMISKYVSGCDDKNLSLKSTEDLAIATRSPLEDINDVKMKNANDLDNHVESTEDELNSIKEILFDGYSLDPNTILDLFNNDQTFPTQVTQLAVPGEQNVEQTIDPLLPVSDLLTYNTVSPFALDFDNLFEDTSDNAPLIVDTEVEPLQIRSSDTTDDQINTPVVIKKELLYPKTK